MIDFALLFLVLPPATLFLSCILLPIHFFLTDPQERLMRAEEAERERQRVEQEMAEAAREYTQLRAEEAQLLERLSVIQVRVYECG